MTWPTPIWTFKGPRPGDRELTNLVTRISDISSRAKSVPIFDIAANSLLALESLVGLLGIVQPAGVVDRDLIARSGRVGAVTTGNNLSLDAHYDDPLMIVESGLVLGGNGGYEDVRNWGATLIRNFSVKVGVQAVRAVDGASGGRGRMTLTGFMKINSYD